MSKIKKSKTAKFIYFFGSGKAEGHGRMKDVLGGKGAGLAEMTNSGVPVPPGFTITTDVCRYFYANNEKLPPHLDSEMRKYMNKIEEITGKGFGSSENPLLVSVRSGAKFSMPGMMDTILNLGLNDGTVLALAGKTSNERFAYDSYRRFIQMFGNVVMEIEKSGFEEIITKEKEKLGIKYDTDFTAQNLKDLIVKFKNLIKEKTGSEFPSEPFEQLKMARDAVFKSWMNKRAIYYRKENGIPDDLGTAVNVQTMVFGNMGNDSGTGVGFTRNPSTGENLFYGEYLINAQGEDVVAGIRTPKPISELEREMPESFRQLRKITSMLEKHYRDVQDFEFTIESGTLYMLQTRTGKRTAQASVKIAVDMVGEKLITKEEAILRIDPIQLNQLLHPIMDPSLTEVVEETDGKKTKILKTKDGKQYPIIAKGLNASPGVATGKAVFLADEAFERGKAGEKVILVRMETCPDDIHGMDASQGILTARGGMTSHAAVVARSMGKCCVAGCESIKVYEKEKNFTADSMVIKENDWISINGSTGEVILGEIPTIKPSLSGDFAVLMNWADKYRRLKVRANADVPRDAKIARTFGAQGIGLCRTEHMFFDAERLPIMQEMILANTKEAIKSALDKLLPMQKSDFMGLFKEMEGYPVTIRLLDPPLHEFLPNREELMVEIAKLEATGGNAKEIENKKKILARVQELHEINPMLGLRGCRLGLTIPEISEMQIKAIFSAAVELTKKGQKIIPEVMIPLTGDVREMRQAKKQAIEVAEEVMKRYDVKLKYLVGTMIELPRAALTADAMATEAEFFSFGTNDLTQTTYGFSRDDAGKIIKFYLENKIFTTDPFQTLDVAGVGQLVIMATRKGRKVNPKLKVGICGEHGGDPESIEFCHRIGLDYVSCSPYRVPIAKLSAAQACLKDRKKIEKDK